MKWGLKHSPVFFYALKKEVEARKSPREVPVQQHD